ncbi:hypothetical protein PYW08_006495 [Mythimna loreyi]|uniref:Uncharacterized protein n=1 Tax=Mythimna loreyi TaxID=667449 RepID=A0ACC2QMW6_9NEOP|nr:hypothetical protein PYW08_006495 [Mythimna loreyi]
MPGEKLSNDEAAIGPFQLELQKVIREKKLTAEQVYNADESDIDEPDDDVPLAQLFNRLRGPNDPQISEAEAQEWAAGGAESELQRYEVLTDEEIVQAATCEDDEQDEDNSVEILKITKVGWVRGPYKIPHEVREGNENGRDEREASPRRMTSVPDVPQGTVIRIYGEDGLPLDAGFMELEVDDENAVTTDVDVDLSVVFVPGCPYALYVSPEVREGNENGRDERENSPRRINRRRGVREQSVGARGHPNQGRRGINQWEVGHPLNVDKLRKRTFKDNLNREVQKIDLGLSRHAHRGPASPTPLLPPTPLRLFSITLWLYVTDADKEPTMMSIDNTFLTEVLLSMSTVQLKALNQMKSSSLSM